jgi:hypothetical protein
MFRFKTAFNAEFRAARPVAATRDLHPGLLGFDQFLALHAERMPIAPRALA